MIDRYRLFEVNEFFFLKVHDSCRVKILGKCQHKGNVMLYCIQAKYKRPYSNTNHHKKKREQEIKEAQEEFIEGINPT